MEKQKRKGTGTCVCCKKDTASGVGMDFVCLECYRDGKYKKWLKDLKDA